MITIRGHEFEFNFLDAKDIEKWVEGRKKVSEKYNDLKKYQLKKNFTLEKYKDLLYESCNAIFELFDSTLGEGSRNIIFGEKCDFEQCVDAYVEFEQQFVSCQENFGKKINQMITPVGVKGK